MSRGREAWLLAGPTLRVGSVTAAEVRLERMRAWLGDLGFEPIVVRPSRVPGWGTALRWLALAPVVVWRARHRRPAIVLANSALAAPALAAVKRAGGDSVTTIADVIGLHSLEVDQAGHSPAVRAVYRRIWRDLERRFVGAADLVLAVNARHAELVARIRPGAPVHVLRDAADASLAATAASDRAALGLPDDGLVVGYVGSIAYRRLDLLLAGWDELAAAGLHLLVVGDGPGLRRYQRRALERGWLGTSVVFAGPLPPGRAAAALAACDVAYTDCWSEAGFPAKVFEYMALGLPIVAEGRPQLAEVLTDGENALLHEPGALPTAAVLRLAGDADLRAVLGGRARASFLAAHTSGHRRAELAGLLGLGLPIPAGAEPWAAGEPDRARPAPGLVSVVVPVRNDAATLGCQLDALAAQEYEGEWELLVADNGSSDASREVAARHPGVRVLDASAVPGPSFARNRGAAEARGDFLVFTDADDVVSSGWLAAMARAARQADLVAGRFAGRATINTWQGLPFASGSNVGVWAAAFAELGGFDERLPVGEDIDLSFRARAAGLCLGFAPAAVVSASERASLRELAGQQRSYGDAQALLYRRYGGRRPGLGRALVRWGRLAAILPAALLSPAGRRWWVGEVALRWGRIVGSIRSRVLYP